MAQNSTRTDIAAAELHNRLAKQIVSQIVNEPISAGGTISDVMMLCGSVLVGVVLGWFQLGSDVKAFDLIVTASSSGLRKLAWKISKRRGADDD